MTALQLITSTKGRIFCVTFIKRSTREERVMVCRTGVKKGVTGKGMSYSPSDHSLKVVYEMNGGFKAIPVDGITSIKFKEEVHKF